MTKTRVIVFLLVTAGFFPLEADALKPVVDGPDGLRAFIDLAVVYAKGPTATFVAPVEISDLNSPDPATSQKAGGYILALFEQSWADEANGRTAWRSLPFWGGGSDNMARIYRGQLAEAFGKDGLGKDASPPAALPAAVWEIENDLVEENIVWAVQVLARIHGPGADAAIATLLQEQHPVQQVLVMALHEAGTRRLMQANASVIALEQSYRPAVRAAAGAAALKLGEAGALKYDPTGAFPPRMAEFIKNNAQRLLAVAEKNEGQAGPLPALAWPDVAFSGLRSPLKAGSLSAAANDLVTRRAEITAIFGTGDPNENNWDKAREMRAELSYDGSLSGQFEPVFLSQPELTVAIWSWERGDLVSCRRILDGCFSAADDDRWLDSAARNFLGNVYHKQMIQAYCDDENDAVTLRLAQHLSKPVFDGYTYQARASELAAQLSRKDPADDVSLPSLPVWWVLQGVFSRDEQIAYLAKRLKLLHTSQSMQPGDVNYDSWVPDNLTGFYCINPYLELKRMSLVSHDFVALAPFAADQDYMRTYSYFRDFHPSRNLRRVCWAVQKLVNETAIAPGPPQTLDQVMAQTMKELNGTAPPKNEILSRNADGSLYFTAKPEGNVVDELRSWAQAQPPRGFIATWWQTPTALVISFLVCLRYRYLRRHPKPSRRSLFSWK